jgi:hypothetical protein
MSAKLEIENSLVLKYTKQITQSKSINPLLWQILYNTLNSVIVNSHDLVLRFPEESETVINRVIYGALRLRHRLELIPTLNFHFISTNYKNKKICQNKIRK